MRGAALRIFSGTRVSQFHAVCGLNIRTLTLPRWDLARFLIGWLRSRISLMTWSYVTKACWPQFTKIGMRS